MYSSKTWYFLPCHLNIFRSWNKICILTCLCFPVYNFAHSAIQWNKLTRIGKVWLSCFSFVQLYTSYLMLIIIEFVSFKWHLDDIIVHHSGGWRKIQCPETALFIGVCSDYVCVSGPGMSIHCSRLENGSMHWQKLKYRAALLALSPSAVVVWKLDFRVAHALTDPDRIGIQRILLIPTNLNYIMYIYVVLPELTTLVLAVLFLKF